MAPSRRSARATSLAAAASLAALSAPATFVVTPASIFSAAPRAAALRAETSSASGLVAVPCASSASAAMVGASVAAAAVAAAASARRRGRGRQAVASDKEGAVEQMEGDSGEAKEGPKTLFQTLQRLEHQDSFDVWKPATYGKITMDDVKKYGAAGTLSYVITELVFWAIAFPTECFGFYELEGHWPDFSKPEDSAAVFGLVFAASNIARLLLPIRFGAALAMAPWVDENIIKRFGGSKASEGA